MSVWCELHRVAAHSSQQQQWCVLWCVRYTARVVGSEWQQHSEMRRACWRAYAEPAEWLTLRAVCPDNGIGNEGAEHLALMLSKNNTLLNLNLYSEWLFGWWYLSEGVSVRE